MIKKTFLLGALLCSFYTYADSAPSDLNMVISVSTDGNYAIATNTNKQAILWNLQNHSYKIIFDNANIYSAYFIKNTNDFMYQNDKTNDVIVEDTNGNVIKTFNPGFPTYGEIITPDLKNYYAVDQNDQVFKIQNGQTTQFLWHYCDQNDPPIPANVPYTCGSFPGDGKLFNLNLTPDGKYLVTSGFEEFYIWNTQTGKVLQHIEKNVSQTVAAINPNGSYLVTGDIMNRGVKVSLNNPALPYQGFFYKLPWNNQQADLYGQGASEILAIRFIDQNKLLVFRHTLPNLFNYAALYDMTQIEPITGHPDWAFHNAVNPISYLPLIDQPDQNPNYQKDWPLTSDDFSRDGAIDTSPSAHILVMSMAEKNGIIVYKYDPATQTLTQVWAGEVSSW